MKHLHEFTEIAPSIDSEDAYDDEPVDVWKWCIRCGALRLGDMIFTPGEHQKATIVEDAKPPQPSV